MRPPRILAVLSLALALALPLATAVSPAAAAPSSSAARTAPTDRPAATPYEVLQLNLCLSGLAGCFAGTEYPKVVDEAIALIQAEQPDAVTVNEACSGDIDRIARETGYDAAFATVIYRGAPLPCRNPGGRGVFGNAVLTKAPITETEDQAFEAQLGSEERRWLCATTEEDVRVCTTHLSVAGSEAQAVTNQAQCEELSALLRKGGQRPGQRQATILAGDVNRQESCAPGGFWTLTDAAATQAAGIQHAYGTRAWFRQPQVEVVPMTYTDHDALLARAVLRQDNRPARVAR